MIQTGLAFAVQVDFFFYDTNHFSYKPTILPLWTHTVVENCEGCLNHIHVAMALTKYNGPGCLRLIEGDHEIHAGYRLAVAGEVSLAW